MSDPEVTVAILVFRSPTWLSFVLDGLAESQNDTPYEIRIIGNDPTDQVAHDPRVGEIFRNANPSAFYIERVYRCMNHVMRTSMTEQVVFLNTDMYVSDHWLDALVAAPDDTVPTGLLVESGRTASRLPEYVHDFGTTPQTFDRDAWRAHAAAIRQPGLLSPGALYAPVLLRKSIFVRTNGYPHGNPRGTPGDIVFFEELKARGLAHVMCHGSVVYHVAEGETLLDVD